jgi:hypothetical protein
MLVSNDGILPPLPIHSFVYSGRTAGETRQPIFLLFAVTAMTCTPKGTSPHQRLPTGKASCKP